jgi:purine-binding chemotaxis protein CheW
VADSAHAERRRPANQEQNGGAVFSGGLLMQAVAEKDPAVKADHRPGKYLTFELGHEEFGIQVLRVREIMGIQDITAVPQTPAYVKGVINLRGKVIPVVDLRRKFGLPEIEYTQRTCIIVVQVGGGNGSLPMGIIVDGVSEVLNLTAADIEDTPDFGEGVTTPYLLGMAKIKGKVKILLEIDEVLTSQELHGLESVLKQ